MKELWVEKHRPNTLDGYVFRDDEQKEQVQSWVDSGAIPHLLFTGSPGTGKTTLAKALLNELGVHAADILFVNASQDNGVDYIRDKIRAFISVMGFSDFKYVLLDEADHLSPNAQAVLRGMMEQYSNSARFILTGNYENKIIPAIKSRCQGFTIEKLDKTEFAARTAQILLDEGVNDIDEDVLYSYVDANYPDLRKCINNCQMNSRDGKLHYPKKEELSESDYKVQMISLFDEGKYKEAREVICKYARPEEYPEIFRFLYENTSIWSGDDLDKDMRVIVVIRNGLVNHTAVADPEINLSATLCELEEIAKDD